MHITHIKLYTFTKGKEKEGWRRTIADVCVSLGSRLRVWRCVSPWLYIYIHVHNSLLISLAGIGVLSQDTAGPCSACVYYIHIYSLWSPLMMKKKTKKTNNIKQTNLKKKSNLSFFWDGKNWQKSNEMKIYGWYKKQTFYCWIFLHYSFKIHKDKTKIDLFTT